MASLFPANLRGLYRLPAPVLLRDRVHPPVSFLSTSESIPSTLQSVRARPAPSMGFGSPSRHRHGESTCGEHPRLTAFRPQRFSRSRRFTPHCVLQVCFTPQPRPGFAFQGFSPPNSRYGLVTVSCPPGVFRSVPIVDKRRRQSRVFHLQGFAPFGDPLQARECLPRAMLDPLVGFMLLRALLHLP